ncbi:M48 family metalloprotease [Sedimentimonas flavescens]|uniref:M48 family metalloprotease n=1 Tax=Sedimentimonas flavescens TaxID=2851012 RepID=UPI0021A6BB62|nr:M48 family metalloprotease [Sedimentimonas flavescens]MCT2539184.1 M48 family metalloprotease [Sedimentimonas flavescens]
MQTLIARACILLALSVLTACVPTEPARAPLQSYVADDLPSPEQAANNFISVARKMEPQIEAECYARTRGRNCDYQIVVDDRPTTDPNAYQTIDRAGRPVVAFNLALIASARNVDELAFVMGHEAAHHIAGHLQSKEQNAMAGAMIFGALAAATGADNGVVSQVQNIGAQVGSRTYSKDYELQADRLGTIITWNAGYDPMRGAQFFERIPDPGNVFLGTHPANHKRMETVQRTVADLRAGRV